MRRCLETGQAYQRVLSSPGYGVAVRLFYSRLQSGDDSLLRSLIPADQYVEAGFILRGSSTYRGHDWGAAVDLRPFAQWAAGHTLSLAKVEVFARQEGYACLERRPSRTNLAVLYTPTKRKAGTERSHVRYSLSTFIIARKS